MNESQPQDWQGQSVAALAHLSVEVMPAVELAYLDGLAVYLLGPEPPVAPYTIEHGTHVASLLLRAVGYAAAVDLPETPDERDHELAPARQAVVEGARRLAHHGARGVHRLVNRVVTAAVGELELHQAAPEAQVRSLFHYGLLAVASGPENRTNAEISDGVLSAFDVWDERIGNGLVPPWRVVASSSG